MEVLGLHKSIGIVIGLLVQLSLMAFGFRVYFKGRHFWGTYVGIALIGVVTVAQFFMMMYWVAFQAPISTFYRQAFWVSAVLTVGLLIFALTVYLYQKMVLKKTYHESVNLGNVLNQVDSLIFVFDVVGNKVNTFGQLKGLALDQESFENWQTFVRWQAEHVAQDTGTDGVYVVAHGPFYLLVETTYVENRSGDRVGRIVSLSDVTKEQTLSQVIERTNLELDKANAAFYRAIDKDIQVQKDRQKEKIIADTNALLLEEIGATIDQMTVVIEDPVLTIETGKQAVQEMVNRTERLYQKLRDTLNQLSQNEGEKL